MDFLRKSPASFLKEKFESKIEEGKDPKFAKPGPASPIIRSLVEGGLSLVSSAAKTPALLHGLSQMQPMKLWSNIINGVDVTPEVLYNNALTRTLDDAIERNSYMQEKWGSKGENLMSLLGQKKFAEAGEYALHSVVVNAPQQLATIVAAFNPITAAPALAALGVLSASEAYAKGQEAVKSGDTTPELATINAAIAGAAEIVFERIGTMGVVKSLKKGLTKEFGKVAADLTFKTFSKELGKSILKAAGTESLEEGATQIVQGVSENLTGVEQYGLRKLLGDTAEAMIIGGLSGGIFTGPITTYNSVESNLRQRRYKDIIEREGGEYVGLKEGDEAVNSEGKKIKQANKIVFKKKDTGETFEIDENAYTPLEVKIKLDPKYAALKDAFNEYFKEVDDSVNFDNPRMVKRNQRKILQYFKDKGLGRKERVEAAKELDAVFYRLADFFENPNVLDKMMTFKRDKDSVKAEILANENAAIAEEEKIFERTGKKEYVPRKKVKKTYRAKVIDKMSDKEKVLYQKAKDVFTLMDRGQFDPVLNDVFFEILEELQKKGDKYKQGKLIHSSRKTYVPRTYKQEWSPEMKAKRSRVRIGRHSRDRVFDTMAEAIAFGAEPLRDGLTVNFKKYINKGDNALAAKNFRRKLIKSGLVLPTNQVAIPSSKGKTITLQAAPSDWVELLPSDKSFMLDEFREVMSDPFRDRKPGPETLAVLRDGEIIFDDAAIENDFANDFEYLKGNIDSKGSRQKELVFHDVDWAKFRQVIDTVEKYKEFIRQHEEAHKALEHARDYPEDWMSRYAIKLERAANEEAFRAMGLNWSDVLLEPLRLRAPKNIAKEINNVFEDTPLRQNKLLQGIRKVNAIQKVGMLLYGLFHHNTFFLQYWTSTPYLPTDFFEIMQNGDLRKIGEVIGDMAKRNVPYAGGWVAYQQGLKAWEDGDPTLRLLVDNGLTLGRNQEWDEQLLRERTALGRLMDKSKVSKAVKDKFIEFHKQHVDWLFTELGTGLKSDCAMAMFAAEVKRVQKTLPAGQVPDMNKIAKLIAENVNDNFGGLHLKRMRRNPTTQYIWQLFCLSPDWTESNIRLFARAVSMGSKAEQDFYRRTLARIFTKGAVATALLSVYVAALMTDDEDGEKLSTAEAFVKNYTQAWQDGRINVFRTNITPVLNKLGLAPRDNYYYSPLGAFLNPIEWVTRSMKRGLDESQAVEEFLRPQRLASSLLKSAYYKTSAVPKFFINAMTGTDFTFARQYTTVKELWYKQKLADWGPGGPIKPEQVPSFAIYNAKSFLPIPVNAALDYYLGSIDGIQAATRLSGISIKQGYSKRFTAAEREREKQKRYNKKKKG